MFCPTCGTEAAEDAALCGACGDRLPAYGRSVATLTALPPISSATSLAGLPPPPASPLAITGAADAAQHDIGGADPFASSGLTASPVRVGWLAYAPSLPRDAAGRIALLAAVALVVSAFFTPWLIVNGRQLTPAHILAFPLGVTVLMALVAIPICWPRLRAQPGWTVTPLIIGACCLGAAALIWLAVGPLAPRLVADALGEVAASGVSFTNNSDGTLAQGPLLTVAPAIGLYIFLPGSAVLLIAGYRLLIAAMRHQPHRS